MRVRALFTDDRAVSSVIGIILLVALAVILAAVVGSWALGLGVSNSEVGPSVSFAFESKDTWDNGVDGDNDGFRITHQGGDEVELTNIEIVVDGTNYLNNSGGIDEPGLVTPGTGTGDAEMPSSPWGANGQYVIIEDEGGDDTLVQDGDEVRVVWTSSSTDQSATIFRRTIDL